MGHYMFGYPWLSFSSALVVDIDKKWISDLGLSSSVGMLGHLFFFLWWVATGLFLISGMTRIICSPEQVLCQLYKEWGRVTRETCSHFSLSYCNFIYFPFPPRSFAENQRIFRYFKHIFRIKLNLYTTLIEITLYKWYLFKSMLWTIKVSDV